MVGNMGGTSLSTAPAYVLGQICDFVDLDGSLPLTRDREPSAVYRDGFIWCPGRCVGRREPGRCPVKAGRKAQGIRPTDDFLGGSNVDVA